MAVLTQAHTDHTAARHTDTPQTLSKRHFYKQYFSEDLRLHTFESLSYHLLLKSSPNGIGRLKVGMLLCQELPNSSRKEVFHQ